MLLGGEDPSREQEMQIKKNTRITVQRLIVAY